MISGAFRHVERQTCQVSRTRHETHAFKVYLTLSSLRVKSRPFASTAVMFSPV